MQQSGLMTKVSKFLFSHSIQSSAMKNLQKYFLTLTLFVSISYLNAQDAPAARSEVGVTLTPMIGWQFGGTVRFIDGDLKIKDNVNYGGILSVKVAYETFIEVSYSVMSTTADFNSFRPPFQDQHFDLDVHYIQVGGLRDFKEGPLVPFGLLSLGATGFVPKELNVPGHSSSSSWSFSIALGAGLKYMFSSHIGIRLQGRFLMPLRFNGFGIYAGSGGVGGTVYSTVNILQGDFSGGLIFAF